MARNSEKANLLLNKWVSMKEEHARGGPRREEKRPYLATLCKSLPDAERWRRQLIGEVSKMVSEVQNAGLGEARLRDLNDQINKCLREKGHWERQIKALGGPDHAAASARLFEGEGNELPGARGYRYFGAARDLPGVRELFEAAAAGPGGAGAIRRGRADLSRGLTPDYYGWRDEEGGFLLEREVAREVLWRAEAVDEWDATRRAEGAAGGGGGGAAAAAATILAPPPPSAEQLAAQLLKRRQAILMEKYCGGGGVGGGETS
jgi:pre-mRNA-splicing factor ISY1